MRVVLDTNVYIAALLVSGSSNDMLVRRGLRGGYNLLTSEAQIKELRRVSTEKRYAGLIKRGDVGTLINLLRRQADMIAVKNVAAVSDDPDDNLIIAVATQGNADYLVSMDKKHVVKLRKVSSTPILHSRDFLKRLK